MLHENQYENEEDGRSKIWKKENGKRTCISTHHHLMPHQLVVVFRRPGLFIAYLPASHLLVPVDLVLFGLLLCLSIVVATGRRPGLAQSPSHVAILPRLPKSPFVLALLVILERITR
jgi:hypothetical protein